MKHQYFGDVNDFRKYGLLRILQRESGLRLAVWWMLTADDNDSDGQLVGYLSSPHRWRSFDSELFDTLAAVVPNRRHLSHVREAAILPNTVFLEGEVPDNQTSRFNQFQQVIAAIAASEIVFFDPDNGFETPSCRPGTRGSSKYVMWNELVSVYSAGKSTLVYQHFPRKPRQQFVEQLLGQLASRTGSPCVICFQTANVGFFLAAQPAHVDALSQAASRVARTWGDQIRIAGAIRS